MVTDDPEEAVRAAASGDRVVLIVRPGSPAVAARPGCLALLVGDPDDAAVRAAATEMESEMYARHR